MTCLCYCCCFHWCFVISRRVCSQTQTLTCKTSFDMFICSCCLTTIRNIIAVFLKMLVILGPMDFWFVLKEPFKLLLGACYSVVIYWKWGCTLVSFLFLVCLTNWDSMDTLFFLSNLVPVLQKQTTMLRSLMRRTPIQCLQVSGHKGTQHMQINAASSLCDK